MWRLGKPIIAAVNGWAMGAGFWVSASPPTSPSHRRKRCVRAARGAAHLRLELPADRASAAGRPPTAGRSPAIIFDAQEALRIGMVNEVVPHDQLMTAALALARRIALVPEPSVRPQQSDRHAGHPGGRPLTRRCLLEGTLGTLAQASHNEFREQLFRGAPHQGRQGVSGDARRAVPSPSPWGRARRRGGRSKDGLILRGHSRSVVSAERPGPIGRSPIERTRSMGPCLPGRKKTRLLARAEVGGAEQARVLAGSGWARARSARSNCWTSSTLITRFRL